ncbi:MAG: caspase family protein [Crocinitomicaceae bacterium]
MIFLISEKAHGQALDLVVQRGHLFPVEKLCFHENNKFLASKDARQNIIIWDFMLGKEIVRFKDTSTVVAMDFLASKDVLVTFNESGFIKYYDIESGDMLYRIPFNAEVKKIIHFNNNVLMMGDGLYLVDFDTEEITKLTHHNFEDIKFSYSNYKFVGYTLNSEVVELDTLMEETKRGFLSTVDYSKIFNKNKQFSPADKVRSDLIEMDAKNQTFFYLDDKSIKQTELFTGISKHQKKLHVIPNCMAIDEDGKYLAMGSEDGHTYLYNFNENYLLESKIHVGKVNDIEFSRDGRYFASVSNDFSVIVWSSIDGKMIHDLKSKALPVYGIDFDEENKTLYMAQDQGTVTVINLQSNIDLPEKYHKNDHAGIVSDIKIAGTKYFTSGFDNSIVAYDIKTHEKIGQTQFSKKKNSIEENKSYGDEFVFSIQPSFDNNKLMVFYGVYQDDQLLNKLKVLSTADLNLVLKDEEVTSIEVPEEFMFAGSDYYYIPSFNYGSWGNKDYVGWTGKKEFIVSSENTFALYEVRNGEVFEKEPPVTLLDEVTSVAKPNASQFFFSMGKALYSMKDYKEENVREISSHQDVITDLIASNQFLFTSSIDGTVKIWDKQIEELIATIIPFNDNSMLIFTPDKYYLSINGAHQNVGYKMGAEFVPFENFDLKYNRPDIVLKRLGLAEEATIQMLEKSYEKRLRKFGFTKDEITSTFYIPTIQISNKDAIPLISDQASLDLNLKIKDENLNLERLNVWVNGIPYFGMNGYDLKSLKTKSTDKQLNIGLSKGKNVIEVSAINVSGGESIKRKIEVFSNQEAGERSLYLITIGVQKFQDPTFNLNYSVKDATNIHDYFIGVNFDHSYDFKLLNEDFNLTKLEELKTVLKGSKPQDQVVLFIATHGLIDADFEYYFATSITNFNKPSEGGIHKSVLDNLLDSIPARNKLVLFDACHSGEIDKEDVVLAGEVEKEANITFRAAGKTIKYGDINVQKVAELEELLFEDFRKGNGSTIMTSSSGVEFSMESEEWNNGLFTYALIDALKTNVGKEDVENLFENVFQKVQELSRGNQTPTMRSYNKNATYFIK